MLLRKRLLSTYAVLVVALSFPVHGLADGPRDLPAPKQSQVDATVQNLLKSTGVPSASVAIVVDSHIVYRKAFGLAQIAPPQPADSAMRYAIGSISKEFLATGLVMLAADGRLRLDDPVDRYIPNLGPAGHATLRQLLQHTAGIRDYWPQDYVFADMRKPISHDALLDRWARQAPDFTPGERWQYSNTGYVLAGMVLEQVAQRPVFSFLRERVFSPLQMNTVVDNDLGGMSPNDAIGYTAFGLGPLERAPQAGPGWLFAAGELAMTAEDLARWDISVINKTLMPATAYQALEQEALLNNGVGTNYALGLGVAQRSERRVLFHTGWVSGFISANVIYPDGRAAIVVLTNADTTDAAMAIANTIGDILFVTGSPEDAARTALARKVLADLGSGKIDRALFSNNGNDYYTAAAVANTARSLARLGPPQTFELVRSGMRGGMDEREYTVRFKAKTFDLVTRQLPDGKIEQFMLESR
jgi:D-alanyl-D-alanine carboxypeptidase